MVSARKPSVGVIGLGSMGMGVARTLVKKGFTTHAFDIRASARKAFARAGGALQLVQLLLGHPPRLVRAHALEQTALILSADAIRHRQIERSEAMSKRSRRFHGRRARRAERKRDRILARAMFWRAEAARYQRRATP